MFGCLDYYTTLEILKYLDCDSLDKLAIAYPDAPGAVRELKSAELESGDDYIDAEEVEEQ